MDTKTVASRFLMQATLGADNDLVSKVAKQGINTWLTAQLNLAPKSPSTFKQATQSIWHDFRGRLKSAHGASAINGDGNNPALAYQWYFHMAWWQHTLTREDDLLRQRITQALSELLVISDNSSLELDAVGMASYYDTLYNNAFGDYADLLYQVALHPCMGVYLSHINNQQAQPEKNIHPDENFAREIMQLFTIGLSQMRSNGDYKLDSHGQPIATYDNKDIRELARVFTGLHGASYRYEWNTSFWLSSYNGASISFDDGIDKTYKTVPFIDMTTPMKMDQNYHDSARKSLLNGKVKSSAGVSGKAEIRAVIEQLVAHPNTAPFIAKHFIKQLVTSNPSRRYIKHVAKKFGKRGNLKAVIEAVLSYPSHEPVSASPAIKPKKVDGVLVQSQKLKSPLLRTTQLLRAAKVSNASKKLWLLGDDIKSQLQQHPLSSPTVFNFYKADFTPHGPLEDAALVAPEFEIHTSATSISYVNMAYSWFFGDYFPLVSTHISQQRGIHNVPEMEPSLLYKSKQDLLKADYSQWLGLAKDVSQHDNLINQLSILLTANIDSKERIRIKEAFKNYRDNPLWVVQTVFFMLAISPNFTVLEG
jgi:uncharacterized protein (DUF1800 family)